jgi:cyanophycinase-like exopeptidase
MGSGEFEPWSGEVERVALRDRPARVAICPAASAPEGDAVFDRWATMGLEHYASIGLEASVVPLKTRADADDEAVVRSLDGVGMVFFSGGNPRYLADTVRDTAFWRTVEARLDAGLVYAGCSAGAIVASRLPETRPRLGATWVAGLGLVPAGSFGAHWDRARFIPGMRSFVMSRARGGWFVGIDERTAILGDGARWQVFGRGSATLRLDGRSSTFRAGERLETPA